MPSCWLQRWSKYMAVTFAVGDNRHRAELRVRPAVAAIYGPVGRGLRCTLRIRGLFFFTEAIFIAIYIFGWRRLKPWAHFWTGVPIVIAGIFGSVSVVAANAWMNAPSGLQNAEGTVVAVDPLEVIFNDSDALQAAHMVVAAYLVGGFLVASVYATGMLRGRVDRYHRLGFIIAFSVAAVATPIQMGVGDSLARWVYNNQPVKFAAIELVPTTSSDVPETILGRLNEDGTVSGGIPIRVGIVAVRPEHGPVDRRAGSGHGARRPTTDRPPGQHRPSRLGRRWAWELAVPAVRVVRRQLDIPAQDAGEQVVPSGGSRLGCPGRDHGGRLDRDRGRPPAVDRLRDHEGRGRGHRQHRGLDLRSAVVVLYLVVGITTILVLRGMSRRFRRAGGFTDHDAPARTERRAGIRGLDEAVREYRGRRGAAAGGGRVRRVRRAPISGPGSGT